VYINDRGETVLVGQEALEDFSHRLRENRKLHYKTEFQGLPISIENRRGSIRRGKDPDGEDWETKHKAPYGYIRGTKGADGDALDVFMGPEPHAAYAYVIHINNPESGEYDEDKVFLGFSDEQAAVDCFRQHYDEPHKFYSGVDVIPMWKFRDKVFVKSYTSKKLVASRGGAPVILPQDKGQVFVGPVRLVSRLYPDMLGSLMSHEEMENNPALDDEDTIPSPLKKKQRPKKISRIAEVDVAGRGTDRDMKKSILGRHQDIMVDPQVREADEGGPGSGPRQRPYPGGMSDELEKILNDAARAAGKKTSSEDIKDIADKLRKERRLEPRESEEHGVKGMKWGVRKDKQKSGRPRMSNKDMQKDPRTIMAMQVLNKGQENLIHMNQMRKEQAQKLTQQGKQPPTPQQSHSQALSMLVNMGWQVAGSVMRLAGLGGLMNMVSAIRSPANQQMFLKTNSRQGSMLTSNPRSSGRRARASESNSFRERLDRFERRCREGKSRVYFARSLQHYGSNKESDAVDMLEEEYPDSRIDFPKTKKHAQLGMGYFHKKIDKAKEVVITPLRRGKITAGVFSETKHALHRGIPVRMLHHGKMRTVKEVKMIRNGNPSGEYARVILKSHKHHK
jgi:Inorganic Pyrophosphatase